MNKNSEANQPDPVEEPITTNEQLQRFLDAFPKDGQQDSLKWDLKVMQALWNKGFQGVRFRTIRILEADGLVAKHFGR